VNLQPRRRTADRGGVLVHGVPVFHLTARLERRDVDLTDFEVAHWLWPHLRDAFPLTLAACLMPDHPHVVAPLADPDAGRQRLNRLLGQLARRLGVRHLGRASEPKRIADRGKLARDLRYVALNPPRAKLCADPLGWLFSTHRDVVGASVDPWIDADRLASALRSRRHAFVAGYHGYVSADPDVHVSGTPLPRPAVGTDVATFPLATIARAVAASLRERPSAIRRTSASRRLFVGLAREQGWRNFEQLAAACACTSRAIRDIVARVDPDALAPARLCLGDARLRIAVPRWDTAVDSPARRRSA
jgi:REP element-mobilizing transposase RayT